MSTAVGTSASGCVTRPAYCLLPVGIRERARVRDTPHADSPDGPAVFRSTVLNLRLLRWSLDDDSVAVAVAVAVAATSDELGRLNGYDR